MLSRDYSLVLESTTFCSLVSLPVSEGATFLGIGATHSCEVLCGFWDLNPAPLEGQSVLLTVELLLQPKKGNFYQLLPLNNSNEETHKPTLSCPGILG